MNLIGLLFLFLWKETLGNRHGFQCNYGQLSLTDVICTCENNVDTSTGTVRIYHEIERMNRNYKKKFALLRDYAITKITVNHFLEK